MLAAVDNSFEVAKLLLDRKANIDLQDTVRRGDAHGCVDGCWIGECGWVDGMLCVCLCVCVKLKVEKKLKTSENESK